METFFYIVCGFLVFIIVKAIYFNRKFKRDSKYPCFVVICQDGVMSKHMYYEDAKKYNDIWNGTIFVDREEFNRLNKTL